MGAELLPKPFLSTKSAIASYDYLDVTTGAGYRKYYACISELTGGEVYFLTSQVVDSQPTKFGGTSSGAVLDKDFDITFGVPATVGGAAAITNVTWDEWNGDNASSGYITVNVYHVRGVTETLIGTSVGATQTATGTLLYRDCIKTTITETRFSIGDILRVNIILTVSNSGGARQWDLWCDPASKATQTATDGTTVGTDLTFDCPFKVVI